MAATASSFALPPLASEKRFELEEEAEVVASISASCTDCDWGVRGREAAVLVLEVDGRYSQHVFLTRASEAEYRVLLGPLSAGPHRLTLARDPGISANGAREFTVSGLQIQAVPRTGPDHLAVALAPLLHARPNTLGRFTDVPLLMWYETERTPRGTSIRYSVIFSNEDGGTAADRLLATWGRLTDIEYVYGIEFDAAGQVLEETCQGKDHEIIPFRGAREGRHPLLYVVTDNNMVKDEGATRQRHAPAPIPFDLSAMSREAVMDANPWTYEVTAREARREGRVVASPRPGSKRIVDPQRYAAVEACASPSDMPFATFSLAIGVARGGEGERFYRSDVDKAFRISRSSDNFPNGCFRGAVALPTGVEATQITALRVQAYPRARKEGEPPLPKGLGPARLRRVNKLFLMREGDRPGPSLLSWSGDEPLVLDGPPVTVVVSSTRTTRK